MTALIEVKAVMVIVSSHSQKILVLLECIVTEIEAEYILIELLS